MTRLNDISIAPRDGTEIMIFVDYGSEIHPTIAYFSVGSWAPNEHGAIDRYIDKEIIGWLPVPDLLNDGWIIASEHQSSPPPKPSR